MKIRIIYNSYSGNTRRVAERLCAACGGELIGVQSKKYSFRLFAYTIGCYRAIKGMSDPIEPAIIDVSSDELIIIGTPVWAGRPTPAINGAIAALEGCRGKSAVIFATCGRNKGNSLVIMKKALGERGVTIAGEFVFDKFGIQDPDRINAMITHIKSLEPVS
jgi:flavodoxin